MRQELPTKTVFDVGDRVLVRGMGTGFVAKPLSTFALLNAALCSCLVELDSGDVIFVPFDEVVNLEPIMPSADLEALRKAVRALAEAAKKNSQATPAKSPPPRYDEVYAQGVEWLESQQSELAQEAHFEFEKEFFETSMSGTLPKGHCLIVYGPPKTGKTYGET